MISVNTSRRQKLSIQRIKVEHKDMTIARRSRKKKKKKKKNRYNNKKNKKVEENNDGIYKRYLQEHLEY